MSTPDRACPDYPNDCMHPWAHARTYAEVKATQDAGSRPVTAPTLFDMIETAETAANNDMARSRKTKFAYRVEIDQAVIDAPAFPRDADWWRDFLPLWFSVRRWWETPESAWDRGAVTVDDQTGAVVVRAEDLRHAKAIVAWLLGSVLAEYMHDPESHVRLLPGADQ